MKEKTKILIIKLIPIIVMFAIFIYYIIYYSIGRIGNDVYMVDVFTIFRWITKDTYSSFISIAGPSIIMFLSIYEINIKFRSLDIKTALNREDYNSYIKKIFKSSYKYSFVLPIMFLIVFIICSLLYRDFNFEYYIAVKENLATFPVEFLRRPIRFGIVYIFNLFLMSSVYISLALLCVKKNKNLITSILESTLAYFGVLFVWVFIIEHFINKYFNIILSNYIDFFDLVSYSSRESLFTSILSILLLAIIAFCCVVKSYKNKEKTIMCLERNADGYEED